MKKLTIGNIKFDGGVMSLPPVTRAMNLATERLQKAGHEVIELELPIDTYELMENAFKMYFSSGFKECKALCAESEETLIPALEKISSRFDIKDFGGSVNFEISAYRNKVRQQFLEVWKATHHQTKSGKQIDAIITAKFILFHLSSLFLTIVGIHHHV